MILNNNNSKKGQMMVTLIVFGLAALIFVFAAPMIAEFINFGASQTGSATGFIMKSFLWGIGLVIIGVFFRIVSSGGSFV